MRSEDKREYTFFVVRCYFLKCGSTLVAEEMDGEPSNYETSSSFYKRWEMWNEKLFHTSLSLNTKINFI